MNVRATLWFLTAALAMTACASQPNPDQVQAVTYSEAHRAVRESLLGLPDASHYDFTFTDLGFGSRAHSNGFIANTRYADTPQPGLLFFQGKWWVHARSNGQPSQWGWDKKAEARRFQAAFARLALGFQETPEEAAAFARVVEGYRAYQTKPVFPEEARRFRISAEAAIAEKRFDDAADSYEDALKVAPWWPEGRFNRALVLGELNRPSEAIAEMKKYVQLVPDAGNLRQAQDQIYRWEDKRANPR